MAGSSMTVTYDDGVDASGYRSSVRKVLIDFLTDDTTGACTVDTRKISGELIKVVTDPGSAAPTANWDVVITDPEGLTVTAGCANAAALIARHTTNTEETYLNLTGLSVYPVVCDVLTVAVANGGNAKTGQIILYYRV